MIESYTGKAYNFRRYNCWHHVVAVRADAGIKTKTFKPRTMANAFRIITAEMQRLDQGMLRVDSPEDYDVIIAIVPNTDPLEYHCGIYHKGMVSHACRCARQVMLEPFDKFMANYEGAVFWR